MVVAALAGLLNAPGDGMLLPTFYLNSFILQPDILGSDDACVAILKKDL